MTMSKQPGEGPSRVALVTGGASGIGLATAGALLEEGWRIGLVDRDAGGLATAAAKLRQPDRIATHPLDVTDEAATTRVIADVQRRFGRLDGVVNSAGIADDIPALETSVDKFRRILDINVIGSFVVARAAAKLMIAAAGGKSEGVGAIVNLASISGLRGSKGRVAYGASKGAVVTMTQVLANDLAPAGIRVNAIAPGPVETAMVANMHTADDRRLFARYIPMNRYAAPAEIASAIVFLLDGTRSSFITGEVIAVDGGFRGAGVIPGRA
jgi:NAD(P)-dependent dehydrogenase (short-subunit alcohol dehydrogenase family)